MAAINRALPIIKGYRIRVTRVGRCGLPLQGAGNSIVSSGFISFNLERETSDGDEVEVKNAQGAICATDRTEDQFKRYNITLTLCGLHPDMMQMFTNQASVIDHEGDTVGFLQQTGGNEDAGVALEIWAGTGGGDDCDTPDDDSIFDNIEDGEQPWDGWYMVLPWVRGGTQGDFEINGTDASEITITGYTGSGAHWGRGPYDVVEGPEGEPARLTSPIPARTHSLMQRTTVRPPEDTEGVATLAIPMPYFTESDGNNGDGGDGEGES